MSSITGNNRGVRARRISVSTLVDLHELSGFSLVQASSRRDSAAAARWLSECVGTRVGAGVGGAAAGVAGEWVLGIGPGRWLVRTESPWHRDGARAGVVLTDLSDAWRVFQLSGIAARRLLAGGCPLDLGPRRFTPGRCAASRYDEFRILLACTGADAYDLYVERSWAEDLRSRVVVRAAALAAPTELDG